MHETQELEKTILRLFGGESDWKRTVVLAAGALAIGVAGASLFEMWTKLLSDSWISLAGAFLLFTAGVVGFAYVVSVVLYNWRTRTRNKGGLALGADIETVPPRRGLIVFVSDGKNKSDRKAIDHHLPALEHCWLVHSQKSLNNAKTLKSDYAKVRDVKLVRLDAAYDVRSAFKIVGGVIEAAITAEDSQALKPDELIVDITGGSKTMTAGAVLACVQWGIDQQYQEPGIDPKTGEYDIAFSVVRRVDVQGLESIAVPFAAGHPGAPNQQAA